MAIYDVMNPPAAPDSTLDSDTTLEEVFQLQDSSWSPIAPGDWVDVDPSCGIIDPVWGYSFQVMDVNPNANANLATIQVMITQDDGESYFGTALTVNGWVQNNFRRVPRVTP